LLKKRIQINIYFDFFEGVAKGSRPPVPAEDDGGLDRLKKDLLTSSEEKLSKRRAVPKIRLGMKKVIIRAVFPKLVVS
jgi:hypothetical protein